MKDLFRTYERLVDRADAAFERMRCDYHAEVRCTPGCSDCCHAVFGLFPIEAAYLKQHFDQLDKDRRRTALLRCGNAERALRRLEIRLRNNADDPQTQNRIMAGERVPCPLLDEQNACVLYSHRPITCRVYGIPTRIQGKARVCGKTGFATGASYPVFDLDGTYRDLFLLSQELLKSEGDEDPERAALLFSVSSTLTSSGGELFR